MVKVAHYFLALLLMLFIHRIVHAQDSTTVSRLDSVYSVLKNTKEDTIKIKCWVDLMELEQVQNPEKLKLFSLNILELVRKNIGEDAAKIANHPFYAPPVGKAYINLTNYYLSYQTIPDSVRWYHGKALKLFTLLKDQKGLAECDALLSYLHYNEGELDKSLEVGLKALKKYDQLDDQRGRMEVLSILNAIYTSQDNFEKALEGFKQMASYYEGVNDLLMTSYSKINISGVYGHMGYPDSSMMAAKEALKLATIVENQRFIGISINFIADIYRNQQNYDSALVYVYSALENIRLTGDSTSIATTELNLSECLLETGNPGKAEKHALISHGIGVRSANEGLMARSSGVLSKIYEKIGEFEDALAMFQLRDKLEDSLANQEYDQKLIEKTTEYEFEKKRLKEQEESRLRLEEEKSATERQELITAFVIVILVIVAIALILIFLRLKKTREQNAIIASQKEKLEALDATKNKFFNNVAHELRTPLTLMSGHMESMLGERFGGINENQRKSLLVAKNNSKRLLEMISEILDLGKLESDKMELNSKPVAFKPLLDRIFFTFESLAHQFQIELDFKFDIPENTTLNIDSLKIEKVFNNLIHNAIKFTSREGKVTLHVFEKGNDILVKVVDNGIGIDVSEQEKVFDRYFQTERSGPAYGGTGIGLAIAKEFMKLHNGQITLNSEPGKGSEFTLAFPQALSVDPEELNEQIESVQQEFKIEELPVYPVLSQRDKVILVVEDHREMQNYIKEVLSPYSKILLASDGVEALKILETNKVDLLTIDLMMPNMDGMKLLREIRKNSKNAKIPTIMLTARAAEEDKLEALTIGVNDYITKPFSQNELLARISNLIENKQVREEILLTNIQGGTEVDTEENVFIENLRNLINKNLDNSDYSVKELSLEMGMSDKHLTHLVKKITGLTPLKFIREIKLLYIQDQLRSKKITSVAEASYAIGIENPSHFTKLFTQRFGKNPSEYLS